MKILDNPIKVQELNDIALKNFGDLVKAVVDVNQGLLAIDAELHSDLEALLLERGSKQQNLWGINFYPSLSGDDFIEFDSMINLRPSQGNMSRGVDNQAIRGKILELASRWITR
jgi:hypothetical protein